MEFFNRKVAGLPVWGWAVAIVGGLAVAYFISRGSAAEPADDEFVGDPNDPYDSGIGADTPAPGSGAVWVPGSPGQNVDTTPSAPIDNAQYEQIAVQWLVGRGISPSVAASAVGKYLVGDDLTEQERNVVDMVIREFGTPPEGAPPPRTEQPDDDGDSNPPTTNPNPDPPDNGVTALKVRRLFRQYGIPLDYYGEGQTGPRAEDTSERVDRIVYQINNGHRTLADLRKSLNRLRKMRQAA